MTEQESRKDNRFKALAIFAAIVTVVLGFQLYHTYCVTDACEYGREYLPTIEQIQERIGCSKIDGIWGPETNALYDRFICNQFAVECIEEALAKQGEPK